VTFIKIRSHWRKFSNSDSVEQKKKLSADTIYKIFLLFPLLMINLVPKGIAIRSVSFGLEEVYTARQILDGC
jgi:hypothetical protein